MLKLQLYMRKFIILSSTTIVVLITGCNSKREIAIADLHQKIDEVSRSIKACDDSRRLVDEKDGELASHEVDVSEAKNLNRTSKEQEDEIRLDKSLNTNLLPSQVNGWREEAKAQGHVAAGKIDRETNLVNRLRSNAMEICINNVSDVDRFNKLKNQLDKMLHSD